MFLQRWALLSGIIACLTPWVMAEKTILCYMVGWAVSRPGQGKFSVLDADTDHCTHVVYAFMGLDKSTAEIVNIDSFIDLKKNGRGHDQLAKLKRLKARNPKIKVLASIGGWNQMGDRFSEVADSIEKREKFVKGAVNFLRTYELDGLDICWQFPGQRGGRSEDKENAIILFREIKEAFNPEGWLLTVHIIGKRYVMDSYNIKAVSDIVDFINLAAVEYSGPWERKTGIMAPLLSKNELNVKFSVDYMLKKGAAPEKILLGLPTYGHAYVLQEKPKNNKLIGLFSNETFSSQWTNEYGIIAYSEMCLNLKNEKGWVEIWDEESQTPLAYNEKRYVSIDNKRTFLAKASLVVNKNLGGVMIWSLDMDDFRGLCNGVEYPQLRAVSDFLNKGLTNVQPLSAESTEPPTEDPIEQDLFQDENWVHEEPSVIFNSPRDRKKRELEQNKERLAVRKERQAGNELGTEQPAGKPIFCYMAAWAVYRSGAGKFSPEHIDKVHCTHIVYAFLHIDNTTSKIKSPDLNFDQTGPAVFRELRKNSPHLKVLISIGGYGQDSGVYSDVAASATKREIFIKSIVQFLKRYKLHGADICWQFPTQRGGKPEDRENVVTLLQEIKNAFRPDKYLLTVHITGAKYVIDSYDIEDVSKEVDYINFATMEYHGTWEQTVGVTTPLTSSDESNVRFSVDYILEQGAPANKVLLGLPTYGHSYIIAEEPRGQYLGLYFDHTEPSLWSNTPGLMGYNELCYDMDGVEDWTVVWEDFSQTPIAYKGRKVVSYENDRSLILKARLIGEKQLAGAMIWSLDMDDFRGLCSGRKYPLLSAITAEINKNLPKQPTPASTDTEGEKRPSTGSNSSVISFEYGSFRSGVDKSNK